MQEIFFGLFGGLGLFVFGMKLLSDGLQRVAGTKLRRILRSLTQDRFRSVGLGTLVTAIVQSSSVTTVMLVGLLNAGIVNLGQAAGVVIGANIGTTITAQIIAFKISKYALPAIGLGMMMTLISRRKKTQFWGQVILACGLVFLGLTTMSGVMKPLRDIPVVRDFFVQLSVHPFWAILLGTVSTMLVQSSSASIALVISLASTGLIDFQAALFLVLGDNIGTTITAWLASIGGTVSARRMAMFHSLFNVVGVLYFFILVKIGVYQIFIDYITPGAIDTQTIARHIANAHTCFNVFNGFVFLFILPPFIKLLKVLIPGEDVYVSMEFKYLQDKLLDTPDIAIESAKREVAEMANVVFKTVKTAMEGFFARDKRSIPHVQTQESASDHLQHDLTFYLAKLAEMKLTSDLAEQIPPLLHAINDLERIGDHAVNISELTEKVAADDLKFSNKGLAEMRTMYAKLDDMFEQTIRVVRFADHFAADRVLRYEGEINRMQKEFLAENAQRLCESKCEPMSSLVFIDYINNLEKIADHLTNVAQASRDDYSRRISSSRDLQQE